MEVRRSCENIRGRERRLASEANVCQDQLTSTNRNAAAAGYAKGGERRSR